jgi:photosystem II stability/assembly factor-like uncharacterized protein
VDAGGLSTGRIPALAADPVDPNVIYVATAGGGVWKTDTGGAHWTPLTDTQSTLYMGAIAVAPSDRFTIYAGTGEANYGPSKIALRRENIFSGRGVLKSTDGGGTWSLLGSDVFYRRTISKIVIDPNDENTVYATVGIQAYDGLPGNTGVWKSIDGGQTWNLAVNGLPNYTANDPITDLVMDPSNDQHLYVAVGNPNGSQANGVFQTFDGGDNWSPAGNFPTGVTDTRIGRITLAISSSSPGTLFAAVANTGANASLKGMYKTTDGGTTWTLLTNLPNYMGPYGDYNTSLAIDPATPNTIYAGGQTTFLRSTDGGNTWFSIDFGVDSPHADHHGIGFDAMGRLLESNDGGIWRLDSPTVRQWDDLNGDLMITQLSGIALDPSNADIAYAGAQDNYSEKFTDSLRWTALLGGDGGYTRVDPTHPQTVFVSYQFVQGGAFLLRSTTGGSGLRAANTGINGSDPSNFYAPYVMDPSNSNRLVLGTNRIYETTNQGNSWTPISTPLANGWTVRDPVDSVAAAAGDPNTVYATTAGHVWVTRDHGVHWMESDPITPNANVRYRDIKVDANDPSTAYVVAANFSDVTGGGHVWMTSNGGQTWNDITGNLPDEPVWQVALEPAASPFGIYVGAEDGVYGTYDGGATWFAVGQGLPFVQVRQLEISDTLGILAAGTYGRGLWELSLNQTSPGGRTAGKGPRSQEGLPEEAALRQLTIWSHSDSLPESTVVRTDGPGAGSREAVVNPTAVDEALSSFRLARQITFGAHARWIDGLEGEWGDLA